MVLTTGGPPQAGIHWQAIVTRALVLAAGPQIGMSFDPKAALHLGLTPRIGMRPPSRLRLRLSPFIGMPAGTTEPASLHVRATPKIDFSFIPKTSFGLALGANIDMHGVPRDLESGGISFHMTPHIGVTGTRGVGYDATGGQIVGHATAAGTFTESHTIAAAGNALLVGAITYNGAGAVTVTAKIGTTTIPLLKSFTFGSMSINVFGLIGGLPTGAQTVSVTATGGQPYIAASSATYTNVSSFGTPVTATGTTTAASHTVTSALGQRLFQALGEQAPGAGTFSLSAYSQTQRSNLNSNSSGNQVLIIGDAPGAPTVNFAATATANPSGWGSVVVPMIP